MIASHLCLIYDMKCTRTLIISPVFIFRIFTITQRELVKPSFSVVKKAKAGKLRFGSNHVQIPGTLLPSRDHLRNTHGAYLYYSFGYPRVRFFVSG